MNIEIISQLNQSQVQDLVQLYQSTWWGKGRTLEEVQKMLQHSDMIIGVSNTDNQKLIGFARVLTDYIYRAVIWDVMVDEAYQKQGLGQTLIQSILEHPQLQSIEAFLLVCLPETIPFYEKLGFTSDVGELKLMKRVKPTSSYNSI
ncbi:MAG: GNAT family N-acetyltransferase [Limnoraphis robusta]|uniref:GCN5 family acetyltransferase n=2 Tax=Limnoraphis robusta TaxID=1118279 RepID=A0A0F5YKC0_9CYAN|nr:GNAT family N-acetyltransferase [Limnoraphis robusta]KKD39208.1 GCN5 family acetyltransferase [Limnoraphis robusta CS-951]MEA5496373.1 GNAT family N-acetyltransferase [Limnoraphis robusta BA-68 BA1]MEA5520114.1 GNAT family N-acetyltransferase [Limnoraphis robusta CCNP1315]MEA5538245.1 GNAT family N-acetyltransferase [Limnoraphis robusta Tam1]MEA5546810.1 GNAT family N-acetyltransferase [Limnoraphis robusta CCNP1324]